MTQAQPGQAAAASQAQRTTGVDFTISLYHRRRPTELPYGTAVPCPATPRRLSPSVSPEERDRDEARERERERREREEGEYE
jgi:hypothetical protein